jgi:hypothetical protein
MSVGLGVLKARCEVYGGSSMDRNLTHQYYTVSASPYEWQAVSYPCGCTRPARCTPQPIQLPLGFICIYILQPIVSICLPFQYHRACCTWLIICLVAYCLSPVACCIACCLLPALEACSSIEISEAVMCPCYSTSPASYRPAGNFPEVFAAQFVSQIDEFRYLCTVLGAHFVTVIALN